jgi:hypothetical protein
MRATCCALSAAARRYITIRRAWILGRPKGLEPKTPIHHYVRRLDCKKTAGAGVPRHYTEASSASNGGARVALATMYGSDAGRLAITCFLAGNRGFGIHLPLQRLGEIGRFVRYVVLLQPMSKQYLASRRHPGFHLGSFNTATNSSSLPELHKITHRNYSVA